MDTQTTDTMWSDKLTWTFDLNKGWLIHNHTYKTNLDCNTPFDWEQKYSICNALDWQKKCLICNAPLDWQKKCLICNDRAAYRQSLNINLLTFLMLFQKTFTYKEWIHQLPMLYSYNMGWNSFSFVRSKFTLLEVHTAPHHRRSHPGRSLPLLDQEPHPV